MSAFFALYLYVYLFICLYLIICICICICISVHVTGGLGRWPEVTQMSLYLSVFFVLYLYSDLYVYLLLCLYLIISICICICISVHVTGGFGRWPGSHSNVTLSVGLFAFRPFLPISVFLLQRTTLQADSGSI